MFADNFFRTDNCTEPYNALKMLEHSITQISQDPYEIKWSIIYLHNLLQGYMVLALRGTSDLQVIKIKKKHKNLKGYEILSQPDNQLDNFLELYEKTKSPIHMKQYINSVPFVDNDGTITYAITTLNTMRNNFIHYLLSAYSVEIGLFVEIVVQGLKFTSFLLNESGNIKHQYSDEEITDMNFLIGSINQSLRGFTTKNR